MAAGVAAAMAAEALDRRSTDPRSLASRVRGGSRTRDGGSRPGRRRRGGPRRARRQLQQPHQPSRAGLVGRVDRPGPPRGLAHAGLAVSFHLVDPSPAGVRDCAAQCRPLVVEPALEFRRARDVEAGSQVTPPPGQRLFPPSCAASSALTPIASHRIAAGSSSRRNPPRGTRSRPLRAPAEARRACSGANVGSNRRPLPATGAPPGCPGTGVRRARPARGKAGARVAWVG